MRRRRAAGAPADPDLAWARGLPLGRHQLGRGWTDAPLLNNDAPARPFEPGPAADPVLAARAARRPSAVADGRAWRRRRDGSVVVLRVERFADPCGPPDGARHRAAWQAGGEACLEETWRTRWAERGRTAGWVEARRLDPPADDADHLRVEDHTGDGTDVTVYEHLTVWAPGALASATVRHRLGEDVDDVVARLLPVLRAGLARPT